MGDNNEKKAISWVNIFRHIKNMEGKSCFQTVGFFKVYLPIARFFQFHRQNSGTLVF